MSRIEESPNFIRYQKIESIKGDILGQIFKIECGYHSSVDPLILLIAELYLDQPQQARKFEIALIDLLKTFPLEDSEDLEDSEQDSVRLPNRDERGFLRMRSDDEL